MGFLHDAYSLDELLARAADLLGEPLTPRTVRLYATKGLIDQPGRQGRNAVYSQRHLLQLLLIRGLARRGLSLSAIAPRVAVSNDELQQQWERLEHSSQPHITDSQTNDALDFLNTLQAKPASAEEGDTPFLAGFSVPLQHYSRSAKEALNRRIFASRKGGRSGFGRWYRIVLAPGVELHLEETASIPPAGSQRQAWLQSLLNRLHDQLDDVD